MIGQNNKGGPRLFKILEIIGTLILVVFIISFFSRFFNISFGFLPFGKANLEVVKNSLKESIDPYDLQSEILTGKVKNTGNIDVDLAIVSVYFSDVSGIEHALEHTKIYDIDAKSTVEFKVRLDTLDIDLMQKYGVSNIYAKVKW